MRLALLVLVTLAATVAAASARTVTDGEDPRMVVDPRTASSSQRGADVVHAFSVAEGGPCVRDGLYFVDLAIWFERRASTRAVPDRRLRLSRDRFDGELWRGTLRDRRDRRRASVRGRSVSCARFEWRFRRSGLPKALRGYAWSLTVTSACRPAQPYALCGGPKLDLVPDRGTVWQRLGRGGMMRP